MAAVCCFWTHSWIGWLTFTCSLRELAMIQPKLNSAQTSGHEEVWFKGWWCNSPGYPDIRPVTEASLFLSHHAYKRSSFFLNRLHKCCCLLYHHVSRQRQIHTVKMCVNTPTITHTQRHKHRHTQGKVGQGLCFVSAHTSPCFLQTCETRRAAFHRVESLKSCIVSVLKTNSKHIVNQLRLLAAC